MSDGKIYYYNTVTKQSSWEKPEELKTPLEARIYHRRMHKRVDSRALSASPWKEYTQADTKKKYYYNTETKVTTWEMPADYKAIIDAHSKPLEETKTLPPPPVPAPLAVPPVQPPPNLTSVGARINRRISMDVKEERVSFNTREEAEAAFRKLLEEAGVDASSVWKDKIKDIINKPNYHALKTLEERIQAFERFVDEKRRAEKEQQRVRLEKARAAYRAMLENNQSIGPYTRWKKVVKMLSEDPAFLEMPEMERGPAFEEYLAEIRRKEKVSFQNPLTRVTDIRNISRLFRIPVLFHRKKKDTLRIIRKENMHKFRSILSSMPSVTIRTTWKEVQTMYKSHPTFVGDSQLQSMDPIDVLTVFEDYMKDVETEYKTVKEKERMSRYRQDRKNRDAFRALLEDMRERGVVNVGTKWKELYPQLKDQPQYLNMLGQSGSTPLELFWDMIMELEDAFMEKRRVINDVIKSLDITIAAESTFKEFYSQIPENERHEGIDQLSWQLVFEE
ncbi:PRP40 pre-mRNA processing factor 40, partial [Quaeritorhiza haematococci]